MSTVYGTLPAGLELARYRVESLLARGGMSEVYIAHDNILGRRVALKVLRDNERVQRFVREAEAASSLNHPAIVSVYDSGTATIDGEPVQFIAMELVDGQTLSEWAKTTRSGKRKLEAMAAVADGLARAHANGIVHRDLKPDNMMIARGGYPKILDFGIAKLTAVTDGDTAPDALLGTAAYMSPEQTERRGVDHRSDVFSFGAVLYEVMTGFAAFRRGTTVDTLHAIAHETPSLAGLDPALARILRRCLAKSPDDRYDSMHDVALDLRECAASTFPQPQRRTRVAMLLSVLIALTALAIFMEFRRRRVQASEPAQKTVTMQRVTNNGKTFAGAISPDGKFVAYSAWEGENQTLWVKQLATESSVRLRAPERVFYYNIEFSPAGDYIYYSMSEARDANVIDLYRVPAIGGEPEKIASDMEGHYAIAPDGKRITFRRFNALIRDFVLYLRNEDGSERELLRRRHPEVIGSVSWAPNGRELVYSWFRPLPRPDLRLVARDVATGAERIIPRSEWQRIGDWRGIASFAWLPDGSGTITAVSEKRQSAQLWYAPNDAPPRKITSDLSAYSNVSVTADGSTILAARNDFSANIWLAPVGGGKARALTIGNGNRYGNGGLGWLGDEIVFPTMIGGEGPMLAKLGPDGVVRPLGRVAAWQPVVSRDGSRIAVTSDEKGPVEIFVTDRNGSPSQQVTRIGSRVSSPSFFPDGTIAFLWSSRDQTLWRTSIDGKQLTQITKTPTFMPVVSPDGEHILCRLRSRDGNGPLWRTTLIKADGTFVRELPFPRFGSGPVFGWTPDGRLAYVDFKDGVANVWTCALDGSDARQMTAFDAGQIYAFAFAADGKSIAISRGDPVSDLVLIRDFRP